MTLKMRPVLKMKVLMMSHLKLSVKKALELNGQQLLGQEVKLYLAKERGAYTLNRDLITPSRGGRGGGESTTVFVKGFDKNDIEDKIRSALEDHFGCSKSFKLTKVSILVKMRGIDGFTTCYC
nr:nucleolin 1-like isoform X2 [Ipomoea batatas]GME15359.1 nucleolin 1-like isoform X2 [Ipomoea batatas]